jgi:hypothetical protein
VRHPSLGCVHITGDIPATVVVVSADGSERLLQRLPAAPDVGLLEGLLRAQLVARRSGSRLEVRDAGAALAGLLDLLGVSDVLAVQPRRQAELGEQLGVEEVVQPRDPPV